MFTVSPLANSETAHPADAMKHQAPVLPGAPAGKAARALHGELPSYKELPSRPVTPPKSEAPPPASLTGAFTALPEQVQRQSPSLPRERPLSV